MCMSSIPSRVTAADRNDLNPSIGRTIRLTTRWSCSTMLLRYFTSPLAGQKVNSPNWLRYHHGDWCKTGGASGCRIFSLPSLDRGWGVEWILRLVAAGDEGPCVDIMKISKPDDLGDIANLGLTLTEAKQLLARVQREISASQAREHAVRRPVCPCRDGICPGT